MFHSLTPVLLATASLAAAAIPSNSSTCSLTSSCKPFLIDLVWGPTDPANALSRNAILTNGSIPGPPLKLKVGDCVDFTVNNNLPNVTGIHFHGLRQLATPWSDGVPGISQYAIQPNTTYTYRWTAEESGTSFYHAHYKGQMMDGLYGAILISPADGAETPYSLISNDTTDLEAMSAAVEKNQPIFASDWSQFTFQEFLSYEQAANVDAACTDSIILNGMGSTYCLSPADLMANSAPQVPKILNGSSLTPKGCTPPSNAVIQGKYNRNLAALPANVYDVCTPHEGKNLTLFADPAMGWTAMTFINPGGFALLKVTIDSHKLWVYEINGHFIEPQQVDQINVDNGDRISILVKLDQAPAHYMIRVANSGINQVLSGFGVLAYKGAMGTAGVPLMNFGGQNLTTTMTKLNRSIAAPFPASSVAQSADVSFVLDIMKEPSLTESWAWVLNAEPYNSSLDDVTSPLLWQDPANIPESDLILRTKYNQWVDLIVKIAGPLAQPHPMHKHANKFYVIGAGTGDFNYTNVADAQAAGKRFNLVNPPLVDGYTSPPSENGSAWVVFRYQANTPGAWLLHCHVQSHFSGGMAVAILDAVDKFPTPPLDVGETCPNSNSENAGGQENSTSSSTSSTPSPSHYSGSSSSSTKAGVSSLLLLVAACIALL